MAEGETLQGTDLDNVDEEGAELERLMDREEQGLADELRQAAVDYKREFKERVRDEGLTGSQLDVALERLRQKFRKRIRKAIRRRARTIRDEARDITVEHNPHIAEGLDKSEEPVENASFDESLQLTLDKLARELLNRMQGAATDDYSERLRQQDEDGDFTQVAITRPADSTIEDVSGRVGSSAATEGRDDAAQEAKEEIQKDPDKPDTMYAVRTSVLDDNTCDKCRDLHGTQTKVGSAEYNRLAPPAKCAGGDRCRCYWRYLTPSEAQDGGDDNVEPLPGSAQAVPNDAGDRSLLVEVMREVAQRFESAGDAPESPDEVDWQQFAHPSEQIDGQGGGEWLQIYSWGTKEHDDHPDGAYEVDREWAENLVDNFERIRREHGDAPPILLQHQEDGLTLGEIEGLRVTDDGVEAKPRWNALGKVLVYLGAIDRISGSQLPRWTDPETGVTLGPVLYEVSAVSREHLKSLPTISDQTQKVAASAEVGTTYQAIANDMTTDDDASDGASDDTRTDEVDNMKGEEAVTEAGDKDVENMTGGKSRGFGERLSKVIDKATTPGGMPGPDRATHVEAIADLAGLSAEQLSQRLDDGSIKYPSDDLLEAVAEWMSNDDRTITVDQLRRGEVKLGGEMGGKSGDGGSDEPDTPSPEPTDASMTAPQAPTAPGGETVDSSAAVEEAEKWRRQWAKEKLDGVSLSRQHRQRLLDIAERSPEDFKAAVAGVESAAQRPAPSDADRQPRNPIGNEAGAVGSGSDHGQLRSLVERAHDGDISRGADLVSFLRDEGYTGPVKSDIVDDVYSV